MNDRWRYNAVSVTRYNPIYRDEEGIYTINESVEYCPANWNHPFEGQPYTLEKYLSVEQMYINAVLIIMRLNKCDKLTIRYLEKRDHPEWFALEENAGLYDIFSSIENGQSINITNIESVLKIILRGFIWCDLVNLSKRLYVRFGYDYYMYFNTKLNVDVYKNGIEKLGLFVES